MDRQNESISDKVDGGISKHIGNYSDAVVVNETEQGMGCQVKKTSNSYYI